MMYKGAAVPYKRVNREFKFGEKEKLKLFGYQYLLLYISMFFLPRVFVFKSLMPFGIAFFLAACGFISKKNMFVSGLITILGYISTFKGYVAYYHVLTILFLMIIAFLLKENKNKIFKMSIFAFIFNLINSIFFHIKFLSKGFLTYDVVLSLLESMMILASCYIFTYGMPALLSNRKRKVFSKEELICIGILIAGIVSGMWDVNYYGISLKNMFAFFVVLVTGYVKGADMGCAIGAILGFMISICDTKMPVAVGIYAICGLISGIFKEVGKIITCIAFITSTALLYFYTIGLTDINMIFLDTIIPIIIFLMIPQRAYDKFSILLDGEKQELQLQKSYIERIKDITGLKLNNIFNTVSSLSKILEENVNNELSKKSEINELVEKLADKVCINCERRNSCWDKELYYTYDSFIELLRYIEKKGMISSADIPESLKKKCRRPNELSKQANHLFEILRLNNRWRKKITNSRKIVAEQTKGISQLLKNMIDEVATTVEFKNEIENEIEVALDRKGLEFEDVLAIKNSRNKFEVTVYRKPCSGKQLCSREYAAVISKTLGVNMERESNKCTIDKNCFMCQFRFVESVNYNIITAVSKASKENISGDNYTFGNIGQGRYMIALSDGMGSGASASNESKTTISLLEKFMEAGFERNAAIKAINSVLVLRSCDECFSTIDMGLIDLYSGVAEFVKIGSAPAFIKSNFNVDVINSMSLPVGILDDIDIESQIIQLRNGDMIITVSDGVIDSNPEKEKWIKRALNEFDSGNPKDVADYLLYKAKENYGNKIGDDMTVMVSKIWKNI
ncbi:stage II sporulation protein E [Caloramator quimbayensis]|uniref:stage II sporulation protein E n=1 Tax=Caloramator quimbayensis TaxID=1147123 RepID=UPI0015C42CCD|nr:stage II sporulation protein E [Caloramator quimbayensis]